MLNVYLYVRINYNDILLLICYLWLKCRLDLCHLCSVTVLLFCAFC